MNQPENLRTLLESPVAIFGSGTSGQGVLKLLEAMGARGVVFDEKSANSRFVNNFGINEARVHRLVVYSPGFRKDHPWLATAAAEGCECLTELDLAWTAWRGAVLAITGTNGKTTLTEFLTHALAAGGATVYATGNIGHSFAELVAETKGGSMKATAVCEVSSFQAEGLSRFRTDATLWTNFAEDHLERHAGMDDYFAAKWNLVDRTAPGGFFAGTSVVRYAKASGRTIPAGAEVISEGKTPDSALSGTAFAGYPQYENYLLAKAWWLKMGRREEDLVAATRTFRTGPHRLSLVAEVDGATWWDDSKATNFHAVEGALASFESPVLLIAGGKSKGGDIPAFVWRIHPKVRHAFLIGETESVLADACQKHGVAYTACHTLSRAVKEAAAQAHPGDRILLSPGFASFDQFKSYEDRGNQFATHVNNLGISPTFR